MDPSPEAPSRLACNEFIQGDLLDFDAVYQFGQGLDLLTIEIENVNLDALEKLEEEGLKVYPPTRNLRTIQNKATQKLFYTDKGIPTSPFTRFAYTSEIKDSVTNGGVQLPFVWKSASMGYDGRGVKIIRKVEDLDGLPNVECIAEELIDFKSELAVVVARNPSGQVANYPVVEMEFHPEANQVEFVICPANIDSKLAHKAQELALQVSEAYGHVGLLAVEMFLTKDYQVLVNEVAPRPHNSGHFSIEGSFTNQFEQHLRAILDLPLGYTGSKAFAIMVNLVGEPNESGDVEYKHLDEVLAMEGVTPHLYGKKQTRPFRKMGHITIVNRDFNKAMKIARKVTGTVKVVSRK
jgi:5-(carboxyamino)imidazole ribonucleotide synthase